MQPMILEPQASWWSHNWKWFVPVGCFGMFVLSVGCCGGMVSFVFYSLHNSWAYAEGIELARRNPEVAAELGEPIDAGWLASGSIKDTLGGFGDAHVAVSLSGSKQKGTLYVIAKKQAGQWQFTSAIVETADGKKIDLLKDRK